TATAAERGTRQIEGYAVRAATESGEVIAEDLFPTAEEANARADEIAEQLPDAIVRVAPQYSAGSSPQLQEITAQVPDEPSAEPPSDLVAQLEDLQDPDSPRRGVYLSRATIASLRQSGAFGRVRGVGVPLANFDGKGGTLIAKNRPVAEELI